mmetsp:Transcript_13892/g.55075  ORF Transcript_13892/g.55075 Transcript_13892/m.55075 type:complete len:208 (+) Transcript_13892:682-1305(+)
MTSSPRSAVDRRRLLPPKKTRNPRPRRRGRGASSSRARTWTIRAPGSRLATPSCSTSSRTGSTAGAGPTASSSRGAKRTTITTPKRRSTRRATRRRTPSPTPRDVTSVASRSSPSRTVSSARLARGSRRSSPGTSPAAGGPRACSSTTPTWIDEPARTTCGWATPSGSAAVTTEGRVSPRRRTWAPRGTPKTRPGRWSARSARPSPR